MHTNLQLQPLKLTKKLTSDRVWVSHCTRGQLYQLGNFCKYSAVQTRFCLIGRLVGKGGVRRLFAWL